MGGNKNNLFGSGVVDALAAVQQAVVIPVSRSDSPSPSISLVASMTVSVASSATVAPSQIAITFSDANESESSSVYSEEISETDDTSVSQSSISPSLQNSFGAKILLFI